MAHDRRRTRRLLLGLSGRSPDRRRISGFRASQRRPQAPSAFLAYRIDDDRWDELALPPEDPHAYQLVTAGERIVAHSWGDEPREIPDFVLDPGSETWSELPDDPLSPGFDRVMRWSGGELLLFDHELVDNPRGELPLRGAALDLERRRVARA